MMTSRFRNICLTIFFLFIISFGKLFAQYPTDSARIYLITVSPGNEIYSFFGHSAIRVLSPQQDVAYGYGTFDFDTPHFYEKFVFGKLLYSLSEDRYNDFLRSYFYSGQAVYQQTLNLSNKEKWNLIRNLQINYEPQNRYYRYDFLYDNCSTRIRDIIEKSVDGKVVYTSTYVKNKASFRDLLNDALIEYPWVSLGINVMLGYGADKIAPAKDYMFLPVHLMNFYKEASVTDNGKHVSLCGNPIEILHSVLPNKKPNPYKGPSFIFSAIFFLTLLFTFLRYRAKKYTGYMDVILFTLTGIIGLIFLVIWIGSLHRVMANNINILWANPMNLMLAFGIVKKTKSIIFRNLIVLYEFLLIAFIPIALLLGQHIAFPIYPLIGILLIRTFRIHMHLTNK